MNIFVTGGTGLIGSHVIEHLSRCGHTVTALVRDEGSAQLVRSLGAFPLHGTVEDVESWSSVRDVDVIVHGAALVTQQRSWGTYHAVNVDGTRHAARTAAALQARLIHISSVAVYGRNPRVSRAVDEDTPWNPLRKTDYYARSKRRAEEVMWEAASDTDLAAVALRPCVVYGERDRTFLPRVIRAVRFGIAPLVGHGNNALSVVYAGSVAEAVSAAVEHPEARGPFNTTNDGEITQREFFTVIGEVLGRRMRFVRLAPALASAAAVAWHTTRRLIRPHRYPGIGVAAVRFLGTHNPYTSVRAREQLKWDPSVEPAEALARSVRWFARNSTTIGGRT